MGLYNSKTAAKMAVARIKLLRNKRQVVVKQMRRDIALLLQSGQDATARIRVIHHLNFCFWCQNEICSEANELMVSHIPTSMHKCILGYFIGVGFYVIFGSGCSRIYA